jgi:tetratricopeptide (TPR) repeat protein
MKQTRQHARRSPWERALVLAGMMAASPVLAQSATDTKFVEITKAAEPVAIDDDEPERSVPTPEAAMKQPLQMGYLMMQFLERARAATDRGDHKRAVKYYRAIVKALPERATSHGMLCRSYEALGDMSSALEACRAALGKQGTTLDDNVRFVELTLRKEGNLEQREIEDVNAVIAHVEKELAADPTAAATIQQLHCSVATRTEDMGRLEACSAKLNQLSPKDPRSLAYAFALSLHRRDYVAADRMIARAERLGLPAQATERMRASVLSRRDGSERRRAGLGSWIPLVGLGLVLGACAFGLNVARRRRPEALRA